jgi:hypothetical protein
VLVAILKQRIAGARRPAARNKSDTLRRVVSAVDTGTATRAGEILRQYRDWRPDAEAVPPVPIADGAEQTWPLEGTLSGDDGLGRALRTELGLPPGVRPNVIVLLLESVRALEILDPEIGPAIFPRLRPILAEHGMFFTAAYSSAPFDAGRTVNGKFSTLCSMLPQFGGPAAYVARPGLRIRCLQEVAAENGYQTVSLFGGRPQFHNKYLFESMHGMERFVDYDFFKTIPYEERFHACDYPDQPFLRASVGVLEELGVAGKPFFASMLTISTHPPFSVIPGSDVPEPLARRIGNSEYEGYLSHLRYLDESLGEFFTKLFAGPLGENTVVVLLGDHGLRLRTVTLSERRTVELTARVPLAILTKHMPAPSIRTDPVHQIDVAPTVAAIAGLTGKTTWLGRNLLRGAGSPWVVGGSGPLHYRVGNRACYSMTGEDRPRCYDLASGQDPLLDDDLRDGPWRADEAKFMEHVVDSARLAIALNLIAPPRDSRP